MDEYGELLMPQDSVYKDILSLVKEHSMAIEGDIKDILTELILEERKLIDLHIKGNIILVKSELKEIETKHGVKSNPLSVIK